MAKYDVSTTLLSELLDDPEALAVIDRLVPDLSTHTSLEMLRGMTLQSIMNFADEDRMSDEVKESLRTEINAL